MRYAVYDMAARPCTFDFVHWLATVGAAVGGEPVHVAVLADRFRAASPKDLALTIEQKRARVRGIIVPACRLLPGATVELVDGLRQADRWRARSDAMSPRTLIAEAAHQHAAGGDVRRLRARVRSPHPGAVVFTIRDNPAMPEKNSARDEWLGAASVLMAEGHDVVLVPDTAAAAGPLPPGFRWCREAATDLDVRAALYQEAGLCMAMGIGPLAIAMHMREARYVCFVEHRHAPQQRALFERVSGVPWGRPLPFAGPGQAIEYRADDEAVILGAFRAVQGRPAGVENAA